MLRPAGKWFLITLLLFSLAGAATAAPPRQAGPLPGAITMFSADTNAVNYADVEAGTAQVTLSWQTVNAEGLGFALETLQANQWLSVLGVNEALPPNGSRLVTVANPQDFGVPTYRLLLKNSVSKVIAQQYLTIGYTPTAQAAPQIVAFTTSAPSIDTNLLVQNNARLIVFWQVAERPANSLIRFEQVLPDGSTTSVEGSRNQLWLPSQGEGSLFPRSTTLKDDLIFRMSVINMSDGSVFDTAEFSVPVIGSVVVAPSTNQTTASQQNQTVTASEGITTFSAESAPSESGGTVTLNWDAGSAESVQLVQEVSSDAGDDSTTLYIELPPTGSMTVPVPEDAGEATFTLRAESADGTVSTGEVTVTSEGEGQAEGE